MTAIKNFTLPDHAGGQTVNLDTEFWDTIMAAWAGAAKMDMSDWQNPPTGARRVSTPTANRLLLEENTGTPAAPTWTVKFDFDATAALNKSAFELYEDAVASRLPTRKVFFKSGVAGTTPKNISLLGDSTATVDSAGYLSVVGDWNYSKGVVLNERFSEGVMRLQFKRGPFMLAFNVQPNGAHWAIWSATGGSVELGYFSGLNTLSPPTTLPATAVAGVNGDDITLQLTCGVNTAAANVSVKVWKTSAGFATATSSAATWVGAVGLNSGQVILQSFGSTPAVFKSLEFLDGVGADGQQLSSASISAQAWLYGFWHGRMQGGALVACTSRQGAGFRFKVKGTAKVSAQIAISPLQTWANVISVYVNGVFKHHKTIGANGANGGGAGGNLGVYDLFDDLDATKTHYVEVRVRGLHEGDDKWAGGAGFLLRHLYAYAGTVVPWVDTSPQIAIYGDSTVEAVACVPVGGNGSRPDTSCGDRSWGVLMAQQLGMRAVVNGFGGTGLVASGSGGMPPMLQNGFNYMVGRPIDCELLSIPIHVIEVGTNDSGPTYQQNYIDFVTQIVARYSPVRIYAVLPFSSTVHKAEIQAVVAAIGASNIKYVNTAGWLAGADFADGVHPTEAGHAKMAALMADFIRQDLLTYNEIYTS